MGASLLSLQAYGPYNPTLDPLYQIVTLHKLVFSCEFLVFSCGTASRDYIVSGRVYPSPESEQAYYTKSGLRIQEKNPLSAA